MKIAPIDQAIVTLHRWADAGYEIAIVTGRPPDSHEPSLAWLSQNRVPHHSFSMVNKYGRFTTENTVAINLVELATRNYCWAVEDSLPMAQYLAGQMNLRVALIDCPWNRSTQRYANVSRYADWPTLGQSMPSVAVR
jgi:uncharacterized HAD superfamily protein